jgi:hypothetical protein
MLRQTLGNRAFGALVQRRALGLQMKLTVNEPGDRYEQEADRVADQVMRMPAPAGVQRKCAACDEDQTLRRAPAGGGQTPSAAPPVVNQVVASGGGQSLDGAARSFFEPRFGCDFSRVRVHADAPAAQANRAVNARAFTYANNIYFGAGEYQPSIRRRTPPARTRAHPRHPTDGTPSGDSARLDQQRQRQFRQQLEPPFIRRRRLY